MEEPLSCVLVLGGPGVGKHCLVQQLSGRAVAKGEGPYPWALDTKYYSAQVWLEPRRLEASLQLDLEGGAYEALLLVFDATSQGSWAAVREWWEARSGGGGADTLGVRMAVAAKADAPPARPAWLAEVEEWCAEQLVEYVESAAAHQLPPAAAVAVQQQQQPQAAPEPSSWDGERAEAEGLARIVEALHSHTWPGMQLKPPQARGGSTTAPGALPNGLGESPPLAAAAAMSSTETAPPSSQQPEFSFSQYVGASTADATGNLLPNGAADGAAGSSRGDGEGGVDQLEQLFSQLAAHRARLQDLPDSERREGAAAMVAQMMAAMGGLGSEDEDESGSEGDEGS